MSEKFGKRRRGEVWIAGVVLLLVVIGGALCWSKPSPVDWPAVYAQNNYAIAILEISDYKRAVWEFEKVVRLAPDWLPGRINLGIALLNAGGDDASQLPRCRTVFEEVLRRNPEDPHAHFCLGLLLMYQKDPQDAIKHFQAVLRKDANDAYSWYWLGHLQTDDMAEQSRCYERALKLNRHLLGPLYGLAMNLRDEDPARAEKLLREYEALNQSAWGNNIGLKYSHMGPYAEVIGRSGDPLAAPRSGPLPLFQRREAFQVHLAAGASWAKAADLGTDAFGEVRRWVRARFGATMVVLDYNGDGKPDLFLAGAVVENGKVRDLLLRNDGGGKFTDVTAQAGLAQPRPTLGCCVGDYDNDERPDLLLTGVGVQKLFRNRGDGRFEDVTAQAALDQLKSVCLGAAFVDLDQDADLDMLLCSFAASAEEAVQILKGEQVKPSGGLVAYLHLGTPEKMPNPQTASPPLSCKSKQTPLPDLQGSPSALAGVVLSDLDGDRDVDFLLLDEGAAPSVAVNDRLLHFRRAALPNKLRSAASWNGALVLDVDHDGRSDVLLLAAGERPRLLGNRSKPGQTSPADWFAVTALDAPPLRQAVALDVNLDSWTDVVGLSRDGIPVLLQNMGGKLVMAAEAFGRDVDWPRDVLAVAVCDANGDVYPDLFVWSESRGLQLFESRGNGGNGLWVRLVGRRAQDKHYETRCNFDGIGTWAVAHAGELWAGQENTTLCAGLGQSRQPLLFGLGRRPRIELLRLRWPDGTLQAEPDIYAGLDLSAGQHPRILQRNRLPGCCPILFAWDGRRFGFVSDFLGAGSLGETGADGICRPPRPEESVSIEAEQLAPREGQYVLKITEPMDEITYLDHLQLVVVDHPPDVRVYPEERFVTAGASPSQQLVAFAKEIFPVAARDQRGRDVTQTLRQRDRMAVDDFAKRPWIGFAEEHGIELDFADRLAAFGPNDRLYLCLAGWTEYPFPESSWAAQQAGVREQWPILERQDESSQWYSLGESGFPAGMPRMILVDVTGKLTGPRCRLRLRTNMHVCWDQAFIAAKCRIVSPGAKPLPDGRGSARATCLDVQQATLVPGRIPAEYSPDGRLPTLYDYHRADKVPLVGQSGRMTRFGDVTELLQRRDDCFVIFGPSDDLTVRFAAASLPSLPPGWKRSFVLRTAGYCKDTALSTAHGATVEPLPFAAMRNYPYGPEQRYPEDALHQEYRRRYLTREVQANPWPRRGAN